MTKIFKAVPFGSARGERQNRVKSVECLDSALLIDTEHCSVERRLKVQANDVGRLLFKLRVIAGHVPTDSMRLNTKMAPDTAHARLTHCQLFGKPIAEHESVEREPCLAPLWYSAASSPDRKSTR